MNWARWSLLPKILKVEGIPKLSGRVVYTNEERLLM
jgi:hypothetical protein